MKKIATLLVVAAMLASLAACGSGSGTESGGFNTAAAINVVRREEGSGTHGAFIELLGIEVKDADGNKIDQTTLEADTVNSTSIVMSTVASNPNAIGYISMGSLNNSVKALNIDGAAPTPENVTSGSYTLARPFNIATKGTVSAVTQDFINYILSAEGQKVVADSGYIPLANAPAYENTSPAGKIVISGSSSVTPVMEKLQEAYLALNPNVTIEIQQSDSTTGMTSTMSGICDIGMASRELKDSELSGGLTSTVIAQDGIAIIVNNTNPLDNLSREEARAIFTGETETWDVISA